MIKYIRNKIPFELKRGSSLLSVLFAILFAGAITRLGEIVIEYILSLLKPFLPVVWESILWLSTVSFNINLIGLIIFIIILFPVYRRFDKLLLNKFRGEIIFEDKFDSGNKGWNLNYWGSTNPSKTNRIEDHSMIFEANESELKDDKKEFGAYLDLRNGIYNGNLYEVSCMVVAEENSTMQFRLWLHDTRGGDSSITTPFITPTRKLEIVKLRFTSNQTEAIRIHLHNKAGTGKIFINEVVVKKV